MATGRGMRMLVYQPGRSATTPLAGSPFAMLAPSSVQPRLAEVRSIGATLDAHRREREAAAARLRPARTHALRAAAAAPECPNCDAAAAAADAAAAAYGVAEANADAAIEAAEAAISEAERICGAMPGTPECDAALDAAMDAFEEEVIAYSAAIDAADALQDAWDALVKCESELPPCPPPPPPPPPPAEYNGMGFTSGGEPPTGSFDPAAWLVIGLGAALTTVLAAAHRRRRWRPDIAGVADGLTSS
jgi:hypothetical protein